MYNNFSDELVSFYCRMALQNPETTETTSALLKEHDNLQKQIAAFEKLLQHAMNRFSREKLFNMLKVKVMHVLKRYRDLWAEFRNGQENNMCLCVSMCMLIRRGFRGGAPGARPLLPLYVRQKK